MKKTIRLTLCISLILMGCRAQPQEVGIETTLPVVQTQAPTVEETVPTAATQAATDPAISAIPYQKPLLAVSLVPCSKVNYADSGAVLYSCSTQALTLTMNDPPVASAVSRAFGECDQALLNAALGELVNAEEAYTGQQDWYPYFCDIRYTPARLDQMVLSLSGSELFYDGTQRSGQITFSLSYDLRSGIRLTLSDILTADFSADVLVQRIIDSLAPINEYLFEDYADSITELFLTNTLPENWYFTAQGLCFYFNAYEIAPQSQGTVLAEIPYSDLTGLLKDEYFPGEEMAFSGIICMLPFAEADTTQFIQFAEVVLEDAGQQYLLYPRGTILNVRVATGTWTDTGAFVPDAVIFAAEALTDGTALLLQLPEEALSSLAVTYESGGTSVTVPWQS